jgi:ABC-type transporter Mla subunit MlaD
MRKMMIAAVIGVSFFYLLSVYATPPEAPSWTVQMRAVHGLQPGDTVEEAGRSIGSVVRVESSTNARGEAEANITITIDPDSRDRIRERATFIVPHPARGARPVLSLIVLDEQSPVLPAGSQIAGVDSPLELELKRQLVAAEGAVRVFTQQLDDLRQALDKTSRSEEKRRLENRADRLRDTLTQTRDDFVRIITEELSKWKKSYDKLFPPEREKPARLVS